MKEKIAGTPVAPDPASVVGRVPHINVCLFV